MDSSRTPTMEEHAGQLAATATSQTTSHLVASTTAETSDHNGTKTPLLVQECV